MSRNQNRQQSEIMKKKKHAITAFLGDDTEFEGRLSFKGVVRVDGRLKGNVDAEGTLIVGESAVIECDIQAGSVIVSGEVHGRIVAGDRIDLFPPARVYGDIEAPSVTIDAGVVFEGNCRTDQTEEVLDNKVAFLQRPSNAKNGG